MGYEITGTCEVDAKYNAEALNAAIAASEELNDTELAEIQFTQSGYMNSNIRGIKFDENEEYELYSIISEHITEGTIKFLWEGNDNMKWGAELSPLTITEIKLEEIREDVEKVIEKDSLGYIILHKDELPSDLFEDYKAMPNVIIEREGTDDEFLKFITVPFKEVA